MSKSLSITDNAKFSGKGVPVCSRAGIVKNAEYEEFKWPFSDLDIKESGLEHHVSPERLLEEIRNLPYQETLPQTNSNLGKGKNKRIIVP